VGNLVQTLLQIAYFYNPFVWFANWMIRRVREQAVDEAVQVLLRKVISISGGIIENREIRFRQARN